MVYSYTPTYYSTIHDSITSLCKTILPFSKKRRLPASERKQSKLQSDNLKWQQDSFHQILNLMGLHKEGILADTEVSAFRSHLLHTLIASPPEQEFPAILRDKLLFLQELLYSKCITEDEYHSSKRPLLQKLAVLGVEIEDRDIIVDKLPKEPNESVEEEWSVIDLKDENCLLGKSNSNSKNKQKQHSSTMKQIKGASSIFGFVSPYKTVKNKEKCKEKEPRSALMFVENPTPETVKESGSRDKSNRTPFRNLFQREQRENETDPLSLNEKPNTEHKEGTKQKLSQSKLQKNSSPSDKVFGQNIKKELSRIQTELNTRNPNLAFSVDQVEAISTQLPADKSDLKKFFPKSWCDRYGDNVLDVVKNEFKDHQGQMDNLRATTNKSNSMQWTTFDDDDENCHPNLFAHQATKLVEINPFAENFFGSNIGNNRLSSESAFDFKDQNPFWTPRHE